MELKEGMYIRYVPTLGEYTEKISKITKTKYCYLDMCYTLDDKEEVFSSHFDDILGASFDIIDLIEVGDYVNGKRVLGKSNYQRKLLELDEWLGNAYKNISSKDIKSIVTKEDFESMSYKVGD